MTRTRAILCVLGLSLLGSGCDAGLGIGFGTRCAAEKQEIRRLLGTPDRVDQGARGELWAYNAERLSYEFSWDQNGENCRVQQGSFTHLPPRP